MQRTVLLTLVFPTAKNIFLSERKMVFEMRFYLYFPVLEQILNIPGKFRSNVLAQ